MPNLNEIAQTYNRNVAPVNFGATPTPAMAPVAGEGVTGAVDVRRLRSEAVARGFVAGYVMANAPALTMSVTRKKGKDDSITANIVAKESKPSRCLAVMMALPANCVQRNGSLASPSDITTGAVDFNSTDRSEMLYQSFAPNSAIAYISALGGRLPEYAPHVSGARTQWTPEDIISGKPEVTFVYVHASENRSRNTSSQERFKFHLKSTSGRRSLYTEKNHVCLRALEHVSTRCDSEEKAYELNEIAFGAWRYRKKKTETENALQRAMRECPTQIWETTYTVAGETKKGIGSAFFMAGSETQSESGERIALHPLTFFPWYQTGDQRQAVGSRVDRLVKRTFRAAEGDKKENMVTSAVTYKDEPNNPLFRPYAAFVDYIVNTGYISADKLANLGSRVSKSKTKSLALTPEQKSSLEYFLRREDVDAEIQAVRDEAADRVVLAGANK